MAVLTKAQIRTEARLLAGDTDSTDPALTDANYNSLIETQYLLYAERVEPRYQRLLGATTGFTLTGAYRATSSITTIAEIVRVNGTFVSGGASTYVEFERDNEYNIYRSLNSLVFGVASDGRAWKYFAERLQTDTEASIGKWRITLNQQHDSSGGATLDLEIFARLVPADLTSADAQQPDVSDEGSRIIARLVAAEAAYLMGEDQEFISHILAPVGEEVRTKMGIESATPLLRSQEFQRA